MVAARPCRRAVAEARVTAGGLSTSSPGPSSQRTSWAPLMSFSASTAGHQGPRVGYLRGENAQGWGAGGGAGARRARRGVWAGMGPLGAPAGGRARQVAVRWQCQWKGLQPGRVEVAPRLLFRCSFATEGGGFALAHSKRGIFFTFLVLKYDFLGCTSTSCEKRVNVGSLMRRYASLIGDSILIRHVALTPTGVRSIGVSTCHSSSDTGPRHPITIR